MKATLTVLGSGTSMGVPTLGCDCAVCHSTDPHDRRTRPSIMLEYGGKVVLIDTTPDFYTQAIREKITQVDAVLYTHTHADHILGIDDLRPLSYKHKPDKLPLYARPDSAAFLRKMFSYIFDADYKFGGLPQLELKPIDEPVDVFGARFEPVILLHGETQINGYRFGSAAYLTDHSEIPESSMHQLEKLDILFLDALRHKPHPTHSTVKNSIAIVDRLRPKRAFFTHICHDLGHEATNATLPFALIMCRMIRTWHEMTGHKVGFKPAGGIATAKDAMNYQFVMKEELGNDWLKPDLFRLGASSLLTDIERQLEHFVSGRYSAAHRQPMA